MTYHDPMDPTQVWECPGCGLRKRTTNPRTTSVTHPCPRHHLIDVPLQRADRHGIIGTPHHIRLIDRGDWIGSDLVQHGGTMAVHAERPDGSHDTIVFPPTATTHARTP